MKLTFNNRQVRVEVDASGAACDAYFSAGYYLDGENEDLTMSELDQLTEECQDELSEYCLELHGYWKE